MTADPHGDDATLTEVASDPFPNGFFDADPADAERATDPSASWAPPNHEGMSE